VTPNREGAGPGYDRVAIAVLQFPGVNCEYETARTLEACGMTAVLVRANEPAGHLREFDGFVLPGGFSYQDRVRAGAVAARDPIVDALAREAEAGKPVLGICNGAQVLVESGLVPGLPDGRMAVALAPNRMVGRSGYYCRWVHVRVRKAGRETAFTSRFEDGMVVPMPMAHGEGRFTARDAELFSALEEEGQIPFRYCRSDGDDATEFPDNPNGAEAAAAALTNAEGNVMAIMPHPERGAWLRQVPPTLAGEWGDRRREAFRNRAELDGPGPGRRLFLGMLDYIRWRRERSAAPAAAGRGTGNGT
jgi:phosphoribosylformylglycinamidine synthase I